MSIPTGLVNDINRIKKDIAVELDYKQRLLKGSTVLKEENFDILPLLLLTSAKFGNYDFTKLEWVAVGLSLLSLGVEKHYAQMKYDLSSNHSIDNLSLIDGDYFYSKGILFASRLDSSAVIGIMAQAIVDVSEAQAATEGNPQTWQFDDLVNPSGYRSRQSALFIAACRLGVLLSCVDDRTSESLEKFGRLIGIISRFSRSVCTIPPRAGVDNSGLEELVQAAKETIKHLPDNECKSYLVELPEDLIACF